MAQQSIFTLLGLQDPESEAERLAQELALSRGAPGMQRVTEYFDEGHDSRTVDSFNFGGQDYWGLRSEAVANAARGMLPEDILALGGGAGGLFGNLAPLNYGPGSNRLFGADPRFGGQPVPLYSYEVGDPNGDTQEGHASTMTGRYLPEDLALKYGIGSPAFQYEEARDGGMLGEFGMLSSLGAMIPGPWQPALLAINAANSLSQGNPLGAAMSFTGAAGFNPIGDFGGTLGAPPWLANAIGSTGIGMLSGMDFKDALKGAALGAGIGLAANTAAPVINDALNPPVEAAQSYDADTLYADDSWKRRGVQVADAGSFSGLATDAFYGPAPAEGTGLLTPASTQQAFDQWYADRMLSAEDEKNRDALEAGDNPPPEPTVTSQDLQRYAKIAKSLYDMLGSQQAPAGAPQRDEDMTPEEEQAYYEQVVSYLGLDPATMAEAGLTPGSPEYLDYILSQVDSIIGQVIGDANPDGEDFSALLRTKSADELQALNRAIYVRGQLGSLVGAGQYADPFTGMLEDVAARPGEKFLPGVAAWQRGLARSAEELAGMSGQEAKRFLGGMLERNPDIYRMQARRDATGLREALEQQNPDLKRRRRGMFADDAYFQPALEGMNPIDLDRMLELLMGGDTARQGAAVEELFGPAWQGV